MSSKKIYILSVVLLLAAVILIAGYTEPSVRREEQHRMYNTEVEDKNPSIEAGTFSSRLPVVNIDTKGQEIPGKPKEGQHVSEIENTFAEADIKIMEKSGRLNTLREKPDVESKARIRVRGNSSRRFDKTGYLFKFTNDKGQDRELDVMGMEKNSTWVLHGPYLDKTLMRNYMWYNLSGKIMEWAPDVRYCEVFLNGEYQGVYVMTEQIGVSEGRIEVSKYDGRAPVSSYIVCVDRESVNDVEYLDNFTGYTKRTYNRLEVKYPGTAKITPKITDYVSKDFSEFEKALYSYDYDTKAYGYDNYIDTDNFVDYFIINEITQNTDAGIFSTYFYKDVSGKLKLAVWDFNNCCDNYIEYQQPMAGFFMQDRTWFFMLTKDENFTDRVIKRYKELRKDILSDKKVKEYIRDVEEYLGCAVDRNFQKWGYSFLPDRDLLKQESRKIGSYEEAVEQYERRLISRMGWMDSHIEDLTSYAHESKNKKFNH